jgi:16S rRNA (guanine(966)-N(2))-methyltransferase RsmD
MQIVSGKYRHRKLESNPGETTRPITARVKVALFDRIQPELQDARVADIFAGTGTIGLEALSRGALSVVFVESDRPAFERLKRNVNALKAGDETMCWQTDASKCSFRPKGAERFLPYDVVFFDPPYIFTSRLKAGTKSPVPRRCWFFVVPARHRSRFLQSGSQSAGSTIRAWKCICSGKRLLPAICPPKNRAVPNPMRPSNSSAVGWNGSRRTGLASLDFGIRWLFPAAGGSV